ncbi:MAG: hypothetical protein L6265_01610 [Thermoplasmatales archaeon]|nr:hypothetical protein [Thermoplasmatales archaeon]
MIRLVIDDIKKVLSFPAVIDVVFYKDDKNNSYRLCWIKKRKNKNVSEDVIKIFHKAMYLGCYAPEVIEGKIIFNNKGIIEIADENKNIYRLEKNVDKSEFLDVNMMRQ